MSLASLELRIPPLAVVLVMALAMWGVASVAPLLEVSDVIRMSVAIAFALLGASICLAGIITFRRMKTTVNPLQPQQASSLVISGIYTLTRNPMYLGMTLVLVAWAVLLGSVWALCGPVTFVLYIGRFQIAPEERALLALFGSEYSAYQSRVRRWI